MMPLQVPLPSIDLGVAVLLAGAGVGLSVLALAWRIGTKLSEVSTKLDGLDQVQKLTGQIEMIDASKAATIPEDISAIREDLDQVANDTEKVDNMVTSVDTIERSVTNIDFEGIEDAVTTLVGSLSAGNSVRYTLEQADIDVVISLTSIDDDSTEVSFRFEEDVGARRLTEPIVANDEIAKIEEEMFGAQPALHPISPRQIEAHVPSSDMDRIVEWVTEMVDLLDENYVGLHKSQEEFDSLLEENLDK